MRCGVAGPFTQADLDALGRTARPGEGVILSSGCRSQDCDGSTLLFAEYRPAEGSLELSCGRCGRKVVEIQVARGARPQGRHRG